MIALAALAIAWPLFRERREGEAAFTADEMPVADPMVELVERRDLIYQAIRELRFDYQVGKVSEADFKAFDAQLKGQAVAVLKEMDALRKAEADPELDAAIEAEIAALRHVNGHGPAVEPETVPIGLAPMSFCPYCGTHVLGSDRFCGKCGAALL